MASLSPRPRPRGRHRIERRAPGARALCVVLVVAGLLLSGTAAATADPGWGPGAPEPGPKPSANPQPKNPGPKTPAKTPAKPEKEEEPEPIGSPGTHAAHDGYGYGYPEAPDCNEATLGTTCVGDNRGFYQGQCTSWVAHRLSQRNGISFSNWYAGRHWGDAVDWKDVAKSMGKKPDKVPTTGAVAWFKRGHVAYVEQVNYDGSIVISEMNFDGANGFRFVTVSRASGYWPDKFLHLADVVPYDATAPTVPGKPRLVSHQGRVGLAWRPSYDGWGVAGYRISRDGAPLAVTTRATYWDRQVSPGQAYVYTVVAFDRAGNSSRPVRVRLSPGAESADRAWIDTDAGTALCGRTGKTGKQKVACTVLTDVGWRRAQLPRRTDWGHVGSRHFVEVAGDAAYCRTVGRLARPRAVCTVLDSTTMTWGRDLRSGRLRLLADGRTWTATDAGPAVCGLAGGPRHQRLGCAVLGEHGWRYRSLKRDILWGAPTSRAFVAQGDKVSYCRTVRPQPGSARLSCTPFYAEKLAWGYDRKSDPKASGPTEGTWLPTSAGPALCGGTAPAGCRVLTWSGWRFVKARTNGVSHAMTQAYVGDGSGVSWCRAIRSGSKYRPACTSLDTKKLRWRADVVAGRSGALEAVNRTWIDTAAGPALCGRAGSEKRQAVGCHVLADGSWTWTRTSGRTSWGNADYRAFLPTASGVSYCRTVGRSSLACTGLDVAPGSGLTWDATETSTSTDLALADAF